MNYDPDKCQLYLNGQLLTEHTIEDHIKAKSKLEIADMGLYPKDHPEHDQNVVKVQSDYLTFFLKKDSDSYEYLMESDEHDLMINYKGVAMTDKELYMKLLEEGV